MAKTKIEPMSVRILADRSEGNRIPGFDPLTGAKTLLNPEHGGVEPWPIAGVQFVSADGGASSDPPKKTVVPMSWVQRGLSEGWIALEGQRTAHKPGGPEIDPWRVTHTFLQADAVIIKAVDGDVRYTVTRNPDKYDGGPETGTGKPTDVHADPETSVEWAFTLELDG